MQLIKGLNNQAANIRKMEQQVRRLSPDACATCPERKQLAETIRQIVRQEAMEKHAKGGRA